MYFKNVELAFDISFSLFPYPDFRNRDDLSLYNGCFRSAEALEDFANITFANLW